jgi:2-polyprenyl-6-methoxyphenol hydroxylase-like FAD-dependent oxidoreductase
MIPPSVAEENAFDLSVFLPGVPGVLCLHHPVACETLNRLAREAGARVVRGVDSVTITPGERPRVSYRTDRGVMDVACRMVVGADGRNSSVRQQAGIPLHQAELTNVIAGLLVEGADEWPQDTFALGSEVDRMFLAFPQGGSRVRLYLAIPPDQRDRYAGPDGLARFLGAFNLQSMPKGAGLAGARPIGPCATQGGEDTWTDEPFAEGVVLIGDAAGYNGPIIGQGLSLALRDAELVSSALASTSPDQWSPAIFAGYAEDRVERMRRVRFMAQLYAEIYCNFSAEGVQRRGAFLQRLATGDPRMQWLVAAALVGPYNLPPEAFSEGYREEIMHLGQASPEPIAAAGTA